MDQSHIFKFEQQTLNNCHLMAYEYPDLFEIEEVPIWYGSFDTVALSDIVEATGKSKYNMKIGKTMIEWEIDNGVLNEDGTKAYFEGTANIVDYVLY